MRRYGAGPGNGCNMRRFFRFRSTPAVEVPQIGAAPLLLYEAFDEPMRCIFIAIPKAGTTSIRNQFRQGFAFLFPSPQLIFLRLRECVYSFLLRCVLDTHLGFHTERLVGRIRLKAEHDDHKVRWKAYSNRCMDNDHTIKIIAERFEGDIDSFQYKVQAEWNRRIRGSRIPSRQVPGRDVPGSPKPEKRTTRSLRLLWS